MVGQPAPTRWLKLTFSSESSCLYKLRRASSLPPHPTPPVPCVVSYPYFCPSLAEYAILSIAAFSTAVHLVLHVIDSRMEGAWHGKATWTMLLEFFSEVKKPSHPKH